MKEIEMVARTNAELVDYFAPLKRAMLDELDEGKITLGWLVDLWKDIAESELKKIRRMKKEGKYAV